MERSNPGHAKTHKAGWYLLPACVVGLVLAISCTNIGGGGGDNTNENSPDSPQRDEILSLRNNFNVSGSGQITIQYNVVSTASAPATASAFYVQVESPTTGSPDIGTPVVFAANAPVGAGQVVTLVYTDLETGAYQVGLNISRPSGNSTVRSVGYLIIEAPPDPEFLAPTENLEIHQGEFVDISFDNRKTPATRVRWRLFYKTYDVRDTDQDGVFNALDQCPQTSVDERGQVDAFGCGPTQLAAGDDFDGDGVPNNADECPATTASLDVDRAGCSQDQLGIELAIGDGNENTFRWDTTGVQRANYRLGVSAADTGQSIAATFAADSSRVVTRFAAAIVSIDEPPPPPTPPTLVFNKPIKDVQTFGTEIVEIEFDATIRTAGATGSVDIFLDSDTTPNNGNEIVLLDDASVDTTSTSFSTANLQEGIYNVGGTVDDSANIPVTVYAAGRVDVVKNAALAVNEPSSPLPVRPNANVQVAWTTNVPPHVATLEVYAQRVNAQGQPEGAEIQIRPPGPPLSGTDTDIFRPTESGVYRVFVRVDFTVDDRENMLDQAPADVRVTTLPPTLWLGEFARSQARIDGAILEGVNYEDNAGTSLAAVPDMNSDGRDELMINSRYAKPHFKNPSGVGEGEAYLLYGGERLSGRYNLNTIGRNLTGVVFVGVRTPETPDFREQTEGIAAIGVIPDLDNDGQPELVFGVPRTFSRGYFGPLEKPTQFLRGGIIIVSSKNTVLSSPLDPDLAHVVFLDEVGQDFASLHSAAFASFYGIDACGFQDVAGQNPCWPACDPNPDNMQIICGMEDTCGGHCETFGGDTPLGCAGWCSCPDEINDGLYDAMTSYGASTGFVAPLADSWFSLFYCGQGWDCNSVYGPCVYDILHGASFAPIGCPYVFDPMTCLDPLPGWEGSSDFYSYDLYGNQVCRIGLGELRRGLNFFSNVGLAGQSGFYTTWVVKPGQDGAGGVYNYAIEPLGARIIGLSKKDNKADHRTNPLLNQDGSFRTEDDRFGSDISYSNQVGQGTGDLIVSAPGRAVAVPTVRLIDGECVVSPIDGEVAGMLDTDGDGCPDPLPRTGMFYMFDFEFDWVEGELRRRSPYNLWEDLQFSGDTVPRALAPKPHQYMIGTPSHSETIEIGGSNVRNIDECDNQLNYANSQPAWGRIESLDAVRIIGRANEQLQRVIGVDDFNGDGRNDIAAGSPEGDGHLYVAFRRDKAIEGDYVLDKLALAPNDPNRLNGILVNWTRGDGAQFGFSVATGVDFNHDGRSDLVISAPRADVARRDGQGTTADVGAILIIFSHPTLVTPAGGISVDELLRTGRAVLITGNDLDASGWFGFNVVDVGDVDGDGMNDMLVTAPGAGPRFDPTPTDAVDDLTEPGLDLDYDGIRDDIAGEENLVGFDNNLSRAGVAYLISGANDFSELLEDADATRRTLSIRSLGSDHLRGLIVAGRRAGDYLGGGDAGDTSIGGTSSKTGKGRSYGVARAGDLDGDGKGDIALGSILADPRRDRITGEGVRNGGEVYIIYGGTLPEM